MKHKVLVYGTLRPGTKPVRLIPGVMYDLGAYPGVILKDESEGKFISVEEIEVDDAVLARLDGYEGYSEKDPDNSLYIRVKAPCGAWIYEYNNDMTFRTHDIVEGGDWLAHVGQSVGRAAGLGSNVRGAM